MGIQGCVGRRRYLKGGREGEREREGGREDGRERGREEGRVREGGVEVRYCMRNGQYSNILQ